ncbi:hypothetical protein PGH45_18400 [Legionella pneumophila]|nr:hypothetical protein [Legionella pneumophila]
MNKIIEAAKTSLSLNKKGPSIQIEIECGNTPDIRIIQHVLRHPYYLSSRKMVIKKVLGH